MTINLTKAALLVCVYFLYKNNEKMNEMRAQLKAAGVKVDDNTVA